MVRTKEVARLSTGDKFPPRKLFRQDAPCPPDVVLNAAARAASFKARKIVAKPRQKASVVKAPRKAAPKPVVEAAVAVQALKSVAKAAVAVQAPIEAPPKAAPKPVVEAAVSVQATLLAPRKRPVCKAALKQKATKTLSKQKVTNPSKQKVFETPSKKTVSEASSSAEIDVSISITCIHCKKRQRLDTEVVELCRREEKRKRITKLRSHPDEVIDLSEADSDSG